MSFNVLASQKKNYDISIFENKIKIKTKISYTKHKNIDWLNDFQLISKNRNKFIYQVGNHILEIKRYITKYKDKIKIEDHYTNKSNKIIGVISNYKFINFSPTSKIISGIKDSNKILAENATILLNNNDISLGIYLNDDYSKINSKIKTNKNNHLNLYNDNLIIKPNDKYIKSFSIYKLKKQVTYFDFVNLLRKDLNVSSYVDGNLIWFDTYKHRNILKDRRLLKNIFNNYGVKYLIITPWLDYDNFNHSKNEKWNRLEFKKYLKEIKQVIKSFDPEIKLLLALQSNVVNINTFIQNKIRQNKSNKIEQGFHHYNVDISDLIDLGIKKEELITDQDNKVLFETYYHDWKYGNKQNLEEIALALKAYHKGYLFEKLVNQINFTIDEIKFDGVYIDQFNQHLISPKHTKSHDKLNANVGKIDHLSGQILDLSENITLNTLKFKNKIIDYALSKTKNVFFNTHHINDNLRGKPVIRFAEGFWYFWVEKMWKDNSRDFFPAQTFFTSHLSTPVSLSLGTIQKGDWQLDPHNALVKNLKFCLYNGNLMYFLDQDFKKLDISKNRINVFKKLYPINIKNISSGQIIGENKIITIVDLKISSDQINYYKFFYFDRHGYLIKNKEKKLTKKEDEVVIHVERDEILIMEKK